MCPPARMERHRHRDGRERTQFSPAPEPGGQGRPRHGRKVGHGCPPVVGKGQAVHPASCPQVKFHCRGRSWGALSLLSPLTGLLLGQLFVQGKGGLLLLNEHAVDHHHLRRGAHPLRGETRGCAREGARRGRAQGPPGRTGTGSKLALLGSDYQPPVLPPEASRSRPPRPTMGPEQARGKAGSPREEGAGTLPGTPLGARGGIY